MNLNLTRFLFENETTLGMLFVDKEFFCWTLEDQVRNVKIKDETAIPYGSYRIELTDKNRWNKIMPHVLDVKNFTGIYIHPGNDKSDTSGCILVSDSLSTPSRNAGSKIAFDKLMAKLREAGEESIFISVENYIPPMPE